MICVLSPNPYVGKRELTSANFLWTLAQALACAAPNKYMVLKSCLSYCVISLRKIDLI